MADIDRLLQLVEQAGLEDDPEVQDLLKEAAFTTSQRRKKRIVQFVQTRVAEKQEYPFNETPTGNSIHRPDTLVLGKTFRRNLPYTLSENDLIQHLLAVGATGSGKTTFFRQTMVQLHTPFWAFDRKQDYRHLTTELDQLLVLPWQQLRLNPLKPPPDVDPERWIQVFSIIFSQAFDLLTGSEGFLTAAVTRLYSKHNVYQEDTTVYPSLYELTNLIRSDEIKVGPASQNYKDRVYWRLHPLLLTTGQIFDWGQGYPVEQLMERNVVFEIGGLNRKLQRFLQQILFAKVYEYLLAQNRRDEGLQLLVFVDEAKQLFSVYLERQDASGMPEVDDMMARARQMGLGVAAADQEASKLTESLKANTKTKVLLPTGNQKQFEEIASAMNLTSRQRDFGQSLGTGEAIVQFGNQEPVPVSLHNHELENTVTDQELQQLQKSKWEDLDYQRRPSSDSNINTSKNRSSEPSEQVNQTSKESSDAAEDPEQELSDIAEALLQDIAENPFKSVTERYESFPSRYKGDKAKTELEEYGLIYGRKVSHGKKQIKLFEITDKGRDILESKNIEFHWKGRGSVVHQYWQHHVKTLLEEQGWEAQLEKEDVDIHAQQEDRKIAVEIALGPNSREVEHVQKHLRNGFQTVVVACRNKQVKNKLQGKISSENMEEHRLQWTTLQSINSLEKKLQAE